MNLHVSYKCFLFIKACCISWACMCTIFLLLSHLYNWPSLMMIKSLKRASIHPFNWTIPEELYSCSLDRTHYWFPLTGDWSHCNRQNNNRWTYKCKNPFNAAWYVNIMDHKWLTCYHTISGHSKNDAPFSFKDLFWENK